MTVAALFVRRTSHYKDLPGVDAYDEDRDALNWRGGCPGVFHPPCRSWSQLSHFAKPQDGEKEYALWAMSMCRKNGGVVEHPKNSRLWAASGCLGYGIRDTFGGILIPVYQSWWGHRAPKASAFYIVGPLPEMPDTLPPLMRHDVEHMCTAERERTPHELAVWLVDLANRCGVVA